MTIIDFEGKKQTPRNAAKYILRGAINLIAYNDELRSFTKYDSLTDKDKERIQKQFDKISKQLWKHL